MWILYILGGLLAIGILWTTGILPAFLSMIGACLGLGLIGWIIGLICGDGATGFNIGAIVGVVLFLIACIAAIIAPEEKTVFNFYDDGYVDEKHISNLGEGIAGIVMFVILVIIILVTR